MAKTSGKEELEAPASRIYHTLAGIQEKTAFLPAYGFKNGGEESAASGETEPSWPAVDTGTTTAGLVGGGLTLALAVVIGLLFRRRKQTL